MSESDDAQLLSVAGAISEGTAVNWDRLESQGAVDPRGLAIQRQLRVLDRIATFHRAADSSSPTDPSDQPSSDRGKHESTRLHIWGHLTVLEKIGEGAFGAVYRARDNKLQREVALKLLWPAGSATSTSNIARALKEGRLLARLRHPNVATVYGADHIDSRVGLWMEFVKGQTLAELLRTHGPFSAREAALIGLDVCRALAAVHAAGVLHGDIKAHNVMREEGGRTVIMDFGTGKDLNLEEQAPRRVGDFAGTPLYLAPEVFKGYQRTKGADIYSLGVLLYHLVTDAYPVEGRTREEVEQAHQRGERRHLRDVRPDLADEFVQAVERALAADPAERHQTAGAFEASLARFVGGPSRRESWLNSTLAWVAVTVVALAVVGSLGVYWTAGRKTTPTSAASPAAAGTVAVASELRGPLAPGSYRIDTALYRELGDRQEVRLRSGARVNPGDQLFAEIRASVPAYVYIVNEDEHGNSYLLFPLPGQNVTNPLPREQTVRLPGVRGSQEVYWQVDQAGGREHFLIFASPERLSSFEQMFAALPHPELGKPVGQAAPLSRDVLRSVGGLATPPPSTSGSTGALSVQFPTPLGEAEETARGLWVRQLTLENPGR